MVGQRGPARCDLLLSARQATGIKKDPDAARGPIQKRGVSVRLCSLANSVRLVYWTYVCEHFRPYARFIGYTLGWYT
jgi:hypothetical protein